MVQKVIISTTPKGEVQFTFEDQKERDKFVEKFNKKNGNWLYDSFPKIIIGKTNNKEKIYLTNGREQELITFLNKKTLGLVKSYEVTDTRSTSVHVSPVSSPSSKVPQTPQFQQFPQQPQFPQFPQFPQSQQVKKSPSRNKGWYDPTTQRWYDGTNDDAIFFYGKKDPFYEFTNFLENPKNPITLQIGSGFYTASSAETWLQALKFSVGSQEFNDVIKQDHIGAFNLANGRSGHYKNSIRQDWKNVNLQILDYILLAKFSQDPQLANLLLSTGNQVLVEDSGKNDNFYGNGADGLGKNMLGLALMGVRQQLRQMGQIITPSYAMPNNLVSFGQPQQSYPQQNYGNQHQFQVDQQLYLQQQFQNEQSNWPQNPNQNLQFQPQLSQQQTNNNGNYPEHYIINLFSPADFPKASNQPNFSQQQYPQTNWQQQFQPKLDPLPQQYGGNNNNQWQQQQFNQPTPLPVLPPDALVSSRMDQHTNTYILVFKELAYVNTVINSSGVQGNSNNYSSTFDNQTGHTTLTCSISAGQRLLETANQLMGKGQNIYL